MLQQTKQKESIDHHQSIVKEIIKSDKEKPTALEFSIFIIYSQLKFNKMTFYYFWYQTIKNVVTIT